MVKLQLWQEKAALMVEEQIVSRGVRDEAVLSAMRNVPRHLFVPEIHVEDAYIDRPLPLGECQTISQPFMVARMTELLKVERGMKVLEIGTGSGYQSAVLAYLGARVCSVERVAHLVENAKKNLAAAGLDENVSVILSDGIEGCEGCAPFERVIITAAVPEVAPAWKEQLADGGVLVAPVNMSNQVQRLLSHTKDGADTWHDYCRFVPLLGGTE